MVGGVFLLQKSNEAVESVPVVANRVLRKFSLRRQVLAAVAPDMFVEFDKAFFSLTVPGLKVLEMLWIFSIWRFLPWWDE